MLIGAGKARDSTLLRAIDSSDSTDTSAMAEKRAVRLLTKMCGRMQADWFLGDVCVSDPQNQRYVSGLLTNK